MLRRLNKALPELILGILLYGALLQAAGVWLAQEKLLYSTGLWIGIATAIFMAIHMAVVLEDAVSARGGQGKLVAMSLLRYAAVVLVFFCMTRFRLGNPLSGFAGVMGLKIAAYLQPFIHKAVWKKKGSDDHPQSKEKKQEE